jgi:hypothetical protein
MSAPKLSTRGRRLVAALAVVAALALGVSAGSALIGRSAIAHPDDPCTSPPAMVTRDGVTLQPNAMKAFKRAERQAGKRIPVVQSYRSCAQQAIACRSICGDADGCPGQCASPGTSYHQLGAAIDVSAETLQSRTVVNALVKAGWCQSLPDSDPGHFSFDGCH